jgi:hypothetical protein
MTETVEVTTEKVVETYIKVRDAIAAMEQRHKEEKRNLVEQLEVLEQELLARVELAGGNISVPNVGRVARRISRNFWTNDWESMGKFIVDNNVPELLEKRLHQGNTQEFLEMNPDLLPPGLNVDSEYTITVRKPT